MKATVFALFFMVLAATDTFAQLAPVVMDDDVATIEDRPVIFDILANDSDPEGTSLRITTIENTPIVNNGATISVPGGLAAVQNNRFVFVPSKNTSGVYSMTYTAVDGEGMTSDGIITVTVTAVDDPPYVSLTRQIDLNLISPSFSVLRFGVPVQTNPGNTEEEDGANAERFIFTNAGIVAGTPVNVIATVVRNTTMHPAQITFANGVIGARLESNGEVLVRFEMVSAIDNSPVAGDMRFFIDDLDGWAIKDGIRVSPDEISSFTLNADSEITVFPDEIRFVGGTQGPSFRPETALEITYLQRSDFTVGFLHEPNPRTAGGRGINMDGDFESILDDPVIMLPDSNHRITYFEGTPPEPLTTAVASVVDQDDDIVTMTATINGALDAIDERFVFDGEVFEVGVPRTVSVMVMNTAIDLSFDGLVLTFDSPTGATIPAVVLQQVLRTLAYQNVDEMPFETPRSVDFVFTDATGQVSNPARTVIDVIDVVCGDGVIEGAEECEDMNADNTDACLDTCVVATCGDGFIQAGVETCDDGNMDNTDACPASCQPATCGDGYVQANVEACDDGNASDTDACLSTCVAATCGDGFVQENVEACDEGANNSDDGTCRTDCTLPNCGDGILDQGEACDDGNDDETDSCLSTCIAASCGDGFVQTNVEACDEGMNNGDDGTCRTDCTVPRCGDGIVDAGEGCDDGNQNNDDECLNTCVLATCGDGILQAGEVCDDGDDNSDSAPDACRTNCLAASCGDGVIDAGETCDDGDDNSNSAANACRTTCLPASCGDGVVDDEEMCDDGDNNSDTEPGACRTDCSGNSTCGDGIVDESETCDTGDDNSDTEPNACRADCTEASCGDGVVDDGEECDAGNENGGALCTTECELQDQEPPALVVSGGSSNGCATTPVLPPLSFIIAALAFLGFGVRRRQTVT